MGQYYSGARARTNLASRCDTVKHAALIARRTKAETLLTAGFERVGGSPRGLFAERFRATAPSPSDLLDVPLACLARTPLNHHERDDTQQRRCD
jgi:hypothetical protein